ncbi:carbohydrate ABC transporter permease [Paenibacillus nasutitermitis]|uniref:carbohydrate ABC transporter permease n=1 Tax=Paenibacillus nasutitermitis TaxID=1652958 RepID=UPI001669FF40|nr:carbohydrate ABC transporter permease [Paenibacillus nasutitermitis]
MGYILVLSSIGDNSDPAMMVGHSSPDPLRFTCIEITLAVSRPRLFVADYFRHCSTSVFFVFFAVVSQTLLSSMTAFVLARRSDRWSRLVLSLILFGLIPGGFLIPTILVMDWVHLYGTRLGFILLGIAGGSPVLVFLFSGFIKTVPKEIDESAMIEGCGVFRLFFQVILSQLKPIIATGAILTFMGTWNDFIGPLIYLPESSQQTLPMTIYHFNSMYGTQWELLFADLIICALPVLIFYMFAQKHLIAGMTAGAVKG